VLAPIVPAGWDEVSAFAEALARDLATEEPSAYTAVMSKAERQGKIFVDYLRNHRGATTVAAYSTRARPGAPVSTPLRWDELDAGTRSDHYTIRTLRERLDSLETDPWSGFFQLRQRLPKGRRTA
jgi:bifunctional non-homologous end joining protein LigD